MFLTLTLVFPSIASAVRFPDVPATYAYATAVSKLSDLGVINGNPDGTFRPHDPVNRAAMLKMLYIAAKKTPEKVGGCFADVQEQSWYEFYVCDAANKGYVKGYNGVAFKPGQPVTRAEALKMTLSVFGIPQADLSASVTMYLDVQPSDWFAPYVHTALADGILPILSDNESEAASVNGRPFSPNTLLERGEAAAFIWSASRAKLTLQSQPSSASSEASSGDLSQSSSSSVEQSVIEKRAAAALKTIKQEQDALARAQANTKSVTVPFTDQQSFDGKQPFSYTFTVVSPSVVDFITSIDDWNTGALTCRLYHLGRSGFAQEYYLGFEDGKKCTIRVALTPGDWRLELAPEQLASKFSVSVKVVTGDGNDGFSQAGVLPFGKVRTGDLTAGDLEDWYTFSVPSDPATVAKGGKSMALSLTSTDKLGCIIYPLDDVDQYGFSGPECGRMYLYPPGTYMVTVRHGTPMSVRESYSIQVK